MISSTTPAKKHSIRPMMLVGPRRNLNENRCAISCAPGGPTTLFWNAPEFPECTKACIGVLHINALQDERMNHRNLVAIRYCETVG
jgi:hypothetical protein